MAHLFRTYDEAAKHVPPSLWPYYLYPPDGQPYIPPTGKTDAHETHAYVNRGRWLARCPFCPSIQHVSKTDPWFFCADCLNTAADNQAIPVRWNDHHEKIEAALLARPYVTTRNWEPHETAKDLHDENKAHGIA